MGDVVEDLEIVLVRDERLVAVRPEMPRPSVLKLNLRHRRRHVIQIDAGDPDRRRRVLQVVDRRHEELHRAPAESELVEPPGVERVRVVEGEALRLDVAVAGAEGNARVAVRQRRRQVPVRLLIAVAHEEPVVRRQRVIDLHVELIVLPRERRVDQVVVDGLAVRAARACSVRCRIQLRQDGFRGRVPTVLRNDVARERLIRARVVDDLGQLREIPLPHQLGWDRGQERLALADFVPLEVAEEERAIVDQRAAERAAVLVLAEIGLRASRTIVEEVVRVERVDAQEFEAAAVGRVGARFDLQVHDTAERAAELGRICARLQLELVERIDAREDHYGLQPRLVVVDAVEHIVVVARPLAVRREGRRRAPGEAAGTVDVRARDAAHDARHRAREADEIPPVQRQRLDLFFLNGGSQLRR